MKAERQLGKKDREGIKKYGSDKKPTVLWGGPDGCNYSNFFRKFEAFWPF